MRSKATTPTPAVPILAEIEHFAARLQNGIHVSPSHDGEDARGDSSSAGRYPQFRLPSSCAETKSVLQSIYFPPHGSPEELFLTVYRWIAAVVGAGKVHLHDIILFPMQLAAPCTRGMFEAAGYDMNVSFGSVASSRQLFDFIMANADTNVACYLQLVVNLAIRPFGVHALNVATALLPIGVKSADAAESMCCPDETIIVPKYVLRLDDVTLEEPLLFMMHTQLDAGRPDLDGAAVLSVHPTEELSVYEFLAVLMCVTDPVIPLLELWDVRDRSSVAAELRIIATRKRLVLRVWHNLGQCVRDMLCLDARIRRPSPDDITPLFTAITADCFGPSTLVVRDVARYASSDDVLDYLAFCSINAGDLYVLTTLSNGDADKVRQLVVRGLCTWRAQVAVATPGAYLMWGAILVFMSLCGVDGIDALHNAGIRLIVDNVPLGRIPQPWIDGALLQAALVGLGALKPVCKGLVRHGLLNPRKHTIHMEEDDPTTMYMSEWLAFHPTLGDFEAMLRFVLTMESPWPRPEIVETWWPEYAKRSLTLLQREMSR